MYELQEPDRENDFSTVTQKFPNLFCGATKETQKLFRAPYTVLHYSSQSEIQQSFFTVVSENVHVIYSIPIKSDPQYFPWHS
jgi:hypothetical protein